MRACSLRRLNAVGSRATIWFTFKQTIDRAIPEEYGTMHLFGIWQQRLLAKGTSILRATREGRRVWGMRRVARAAAQVVENLEGRQLLNAVTSLTLVNADTDKDIMALGNGATINLGKLPTRNLNVRANVDSSAESVRFALDGNSNFTTESGAPFAMAGDAAGNYVAWSPSLGTHTVKATPYSADFAGGSAGTALSVSFKVVWDSSTPNSSGTTGTSGGTTSGSTTGTTSGSTTGPVAAPSDLAVTGVYSNRIDLKWDDNSNNESKFDVLRSTDGWNYTIHASVGAGQTTFGDSAVTAGKTYYYKVRSANSTDRSVPSNIAKGTTGGGTAPALATPVVTEPVDEDTSVPSSPSNLAATGTSSQVTLDWADNSDNEQGFRVLRSTDGANFTQVGTTGANDSDYTDGSVSSGKHYYYRVFAYNAEGASSNYTSDSADTAEASSAPADDSSSVGSGVLSALPQGVVNAAIGEPLVRYNRYISGGAHTNQPADGESPMILALAAYQGNTSADSRLLQQIRYSITGGNEITATGGYATQHERHVTSMFALAKMTPRIWNSLSSTEKKKVDLVMKAGLVASAFTTGDNNPFILSRTKQYALDGDGNLGRDYNPNYREGMIGGVLVGLVYFGGPSAAGAVLAGYDHDSFVGELKAYGLSNIAQTFTWKASNPTSGAPSGSMIENAVRSYKYYGLGLSQYMDIYAKLTNYTFGKTVSSGLNGGSGYNGWGKIASGADSLPNKGAVGMLMEFDSADANGVRSSAGYAYDGFRTNQANQLVLVAGGYWQEGHSSAKASLSRVKIGVTDLWYKLERGYLNYAKGTSAGTTSLTSSDRGYSYTRTVWENVLREFHGI